MLAAKLFKLKDYQLLSIGWLLMLALVCVNCTIHSLFIAKERVDIVSSIFWSLQEYGAWLFLTPAICFALNAKTHRARPLQFSLIGFYAISIVLVVNTSLDVVIDGARWQESLFYNWHKHLIAYLAIVSVWLIKNSVFSNSESVTEHRVPTSALPQTKQELEQSSLAPAQTLKTHLTLQGYSICIADICYAKASGNYVEVFTKDQEYLLRLTMKELEQQLPTQQFFRSHRSYLVNLSQTKAVKNARAGHGILVLNDAYEVPVSKSKRTAIKHALEPVI